MRIYIYTPLFTFMIFLNYVQSSSQPSRPDLAGAPGTPRPGSFPFNVRLTRPPGSTEIRRPQRSVEHPVVKGKLVWRDGFPVAYIKNGKTYYLGPIDKTPVGSLRRDGRIQVAVELPDDAIVMRNSVLLGRIHKKRIHKINPENGATMNYITPPRNNDVVLYNGDPIAIYDDGYRHMNLLIR